MLYAPLVATIAAFAYLLGSIPFGLLIARSQGLDIRKHGSGNIGATNVWRVMGRKWGLTTFICDLAKGLVAVLLAKYAAAHWPITIPLPHGHSEVEYFGSDAAGITAAVACILGHNFPVWLKFKGGKGVATSLGVIAGMMPLASITIFAIWGIMVKLTRYVSLASIVAALSLPLVVLLLLMTPGPLGMQGWGCFYFALVATALVIIRHRGNISRLMAGTESRVGEKKTEEGEPAAAPTAPSDSAPPQP